jgi:rhamnosyltransferase subunit B
MSHFLITALGSYGDVHPMVGLGQSLAARGHNVKIVTNPYFEDVVTQAGLPIVPLGTCEDYVELSRHPDLWHPVRGPRMILGFATGRMLRPLYELLTSNYVAGDTVLCAHAMDLASRVVGEKLGAPVASVVFAPAVLWSAYDSPRLKGVPLGSWVPRWLKRFQFWAVDTLFVQRLLGTELNKLRVELGLRPVRRILSQWLYASDLVLAMFPEWFGPHQPDWSPRTRTVGFPLWDSPGEKRLPDDVQQFLDAGESPIAFSPGSANHEAHQFFAAAVEACQLLGRRGILLTKYDHQLPAKLPNDVRHVGFVPMSQLLPRSAALVHHGGIGSCGQGLAAGIPQIVRPMSYDQFDNARRIVRLGVGRELSMRGFTAKQVAAMLAPLLESKTVAGQCRELASRCNGPAALTAACVELERLLEREAVATGIAAG